MFLFYSVFPRLNARREIQRIFLWTEFELFRERIEVSPGFSTGGSVHMEGVDPEDLEAKYASWFFGQALFLDVALLGISHFGLDLEMAQREDVGLKVTR